MKWHIVAQALAGAVAGVLIALGVADQGIRDGLCGQRDAAAMARPPVADESRSSSGELIP